MWKKSVGAAGKSAIPKGATKKPGKNMSKLPKAKLAGTLSKFHKSGKVSANIP